MNERITALQPYLLASAKKYGTPLYFLDTEQLTTQANAFKKAFGKGVRFFYAFKSNDLPFLITTLKKAGINADVASFFELQLAVRLGFQRIIYTAPYKSEEALAFALKHRQQVIINVDDLAELERIAVQATRLPKGSLRLSLRLRATGSRWGKFGLSQREAVVAGKIISEKSALSLVGLHFHASWNRSPEFYERNLQEIRQLLDQHPTLSSELAFIDIGGGYLVEGVRTHFMKEGAPLLTFAKRITKRFSDLFPGLELWLEPGRALSSASTMILTRVHAIRKGRLRVDAGTQLIGGTEYEKTSAMIINATRPSQKHIKAVIDGPLCDPADRWGSSYYGKECEQGDLLAILDLGAYSFSTAWRWQQPIAGYVALQGKQLVLVKSEESFAQRYAGCKL